MSKEKNKGGVVTVILVSTLLAFAAVCAFKVIPQLIENWKSRDAYDGMRSSVMTDEQEGEIAVSALSADPVENKYLHIDWEKLKDTGTMAWIELDDINYPVMYKKGDNDYYLHHLSDDTYNDSGSIFIQGQSSPYFTDRNTFIYGHNMLNHTMFSDLKRYLSPEHKDHEIKIYLPDGTVHIYKIFAAISCETGTEPYRYLYNSDEEYLKYQETVLSLSQYETGAKPDKNAKLVSLSTCDGYTGTTHRSLLIGREEKTEKVQKAASWYTPS